MCLVCVLPWVCMLGLAFTPLLLTADVFSLCASMGVYAGSSLHSTTVNC